MKLIRLGRRPDYKELTSRVNRAFQERNINIVEKPEVRKDGLAGFMKSRSDKPNAKLKKKELRDFVDKIFDRN